MAISYPLTFPTHIEPSSMTLSASNVVTRTQSPFSMKQQVIAHAGQLWGATVKLPPMARADAEQWVAWLMSLKGQVGTFTMGDPTATTALGSAGGTPLVNGASQTGNELILDGASSSQTGWLKAGDYIQLGTGATTRLHKVMTDADTDGSGNTTLDIWPNLRESPADNAAVTVANTKGLWSLANNAQEWSLNQVALFGVEFSCVEALR